MQEHLANAELNSSFGSCVDQKREQILSLQSTGEQNLDSESMTIGICVRALDV